ncbi:MAG: hypothetical protein JW939_07275 [Candidatus Thermoplasmatota archaeon]|nr:hypothetical protein [Candidatus Thermoplasmatota archaeon]
MADTPLTIGSAIILLVLALPNFAIAERDFDGPEQTIDMVEMEIDEDRISIDVSFNGSFTGQIHCRATLLLDLGILIEYVDLYIEPSFDDHISVVLEEYEARLTPEDPVYEFTANISVDPGTSSTLNPIVTMDGTVKTNRGTTGSVLEDSASVRILPYYSSNIYFIDPTGEMDTGSTETFSLTMENTGNSAENFILHVTNSEFLASNDIEVTFEEARVYLEEGGRKQIDVKVKVGDRATRGSYLVKISAWSEKNGGMTEEDTPATLTLNVDEAYILFIEAFIKDPVYLWIGLALLVVILAFLFWVGLKVREHLLWKRTLRRLREANRVDDRESEDVTFEREEVN